MSATFEEVKWFMQLQGRVQGPFTTPSLQSTLEHLDPAHLAKTLVWRRGFAEWVKANKWQSEDHTQTMTMTHVAEPVQKNDPSFEATAVFPPSSPSANPQKTMNEGAFYRVQLNFIDQPPMTKNELLSLIEKQKDVSNIAIQDPQTKEWKEVYAFPDLIEKLGLSRRQAPRVPILAQFNGRSNRHEHLVARIITISEGGVGFTEVYDLKIGDEIQGQITSPHFFQPLNIQADVVYSGLDGYVGVQFNQINDESRAAIIDYIKKFGRGSNPT